ncbi:MAG: hypothetical protein ACI9K2_007235, partial [Myxococcota bacterium]
MKAARVVGVLLGVQLALAGVYFAVEAGRRAPTPFVVEALDEPAPELSMTRGGGSVARPSQPHL